MSDLFDIHFELRLRAAWATVAATVDTFKAQFPSIEDQSILADAYAALAPGGDITALDVRPGYTSTDRAKLPAVIITMDESPVEDQPLGYATGALGDGEDGEGILLRQTLTVYVVASHPVAARLLYGALRNALLAEHRWFYAQGYRGFQFEGGGGFTPSQDWMPEYLGAFGRTQRWSALAHADFGVVAASHNSGVVASTDLSVGGTVGGVTAVQQAAS